MILSCLTIKRVTILSKNTIKLVAYQDKPIKKSLSKVKLSKN